MAISYDLDHATDSSAAEVAARLAEIGKSIGVFDAAVTPELLMDPGVNTLRGTWIRVTRQRPPQPWHPVLADLHFTPTVSAAGARSAWPSTSKWRTRGRRSLANPPDLLRDPGSYPRARRFED